MAPVLTPVVEEIIVSATRPASQTIGSRLGLGVRGGLAGFFAIVGGLFIEAVLRKLADQLQDEAVREFESIQPRVLPDTPVQTIDEIIVRGVPTPPRRPPHPEFRPGEPFFEPLFPPGAPPGLPGRVPDPLDDPLEFPEIFPRPTVLPGEPVVIPQPFQPPATRPLGDPFRFVVGDPFPFTIGDPFPLTEFVPAPVGLPSPTPGGRPIPVPVLFPIGDPLPLSVPSFRDQPTLPPTASPFTFTSPSPVPQPELAQQGCPKCPEPEEDPDEVERDECFKKLVKEGVTPNLDETFNWVRIDCFSGAEI